MKCAVIRDLLPGYADDLCSQESRAMIEEHLEKCQACRQCLEVMKEELPDVPEETAQGDDTGELRILRAMKKVVWRRVWGMVAGLIAAALACGLVVILVMAQFHPEWDLLNVEHYCMRQTAVRATKQFAQGDLEGALAGVKRLAAFGDETQKDYDGDVYETCMAQLQKEYDALFDGETKESLEIEEVFSGTVGEGEWEKHCEDVFLKNGVCLGFEFTNRDEYTVSITAPDGAEDTEQLESMNGLLGYMCSGTAYEQAVQQRFRNLLDVLYNKDSQFTQKSATINICYLFTEDPYRMRGQEDMTDTERAWVERWLALPESCKITGFSVENMGVDSAAGKVKRKMLWQVEDTAGHQGVFMKTFYFGSEGYAPADDQETILGEKLRAGCVQALQQLFDQDSAS